MPSNMTNKITLLFEKRRRIFVFMLELVEWDFWGNHIVSTKYLLALSMTNFCKRTWLATFSEVLPL